MLHRHAVVNPSIGSVSQQAPLLNFNFARDSTKTASSAVNGQWTLPKSSKTIPCPMSGEDFIRVPDTQPDEAQPFIDSLKSVPKSGLHNPYKNPERYSLILLERQHSWKGVLARRRMRLSSIW